MRFPLLLLSLIASSATAFVGAFGVGPVAWHTTKSSPRCQPLRQLHHLAAAAAGAADNNSRKTNEFSRPIDSTRILKTRRDYQTEIVATAEECQALARRFELPQISSLSAVMWLRQEEMSGIRTTTGGYASSATSAGAGIEVEGNVTAMVKRICVRTNQPFTVDLQIPLYSLVRPVTPWSTLLAQRNELEQILQASTSSSNKNSRNKKESDTKGSNNKGRKRQNAGLVTENSGRDLLQLQRMLQKQISEEDDVVMEDEAIYTTDGMLDAGELVAQLFWLALDPYPKKPGTDPIFVSITG